MDYIPEPIWENASAVFLIFGNQLTWKLANDLKAKYKQMDIYVRVSSLDESSNSWHKLYYIGDKCAGSDPVDIETLFGKFFLSK